MKTLEEIVQLQIKGDTLNADHVRFMKSVMERTYGSGSTQYNGWYPQLFYNSSVDSGERDVLVVDVHTDTPSAEHGDPGGILYLGVGDPVVEFFVVNDVMYAGPMFSSYEFVTPIDKRLIDKDFQENLPSMTAPTWAQHTHT